MRLIRIPLAVIVIGFSVMAACSKGRSVGPGLIGDWRLIRAGGGIAGTEVYTGPPIILRLRSDSTYIRYYNGTPAEVGIYSLSVNTGGATPDSILIFKYDTTSYKREMSLWGGQLFLMEPVVEGIEELFAKAH